MSVATLALIIAVATLGPLLASREGLRIPVVVGELLAGVVIGRTGLQLVDAGDRTFAFLADIGFALIMFVVGSHVPVRNRALRASIRPGILRASAVGAIAAGLGFALAAIFDTGHGGLYAVLMASSSAALVLPVIDAAGWSGPAVLQLLPQVAVADAACIVALPLVIDPIHAARAAVGALALLACAGLLYLILARAEASGLRRRLHRISEKRGFALELRISLIILLVLADLAISVHVSIMLAGFSFGLVVAAIGEPKRLARQLFALTEGFLGPIFFVWLGAALNLRDLATHPAAILLGAVLGIAAALAHASMAVTGQPWPLSFMSGAQLGVPVAAVTLGTQLQLLRSGEGAAILLGALVTIVITSVSSRFVQSGEPPAPGVPIQDPP